MKSYYIDLIEKTAAQNREEEIRSEVQKNLSDSRKAAYTGAIGSTAGLMASKAGFDLANKQRQSGAIDGIVRRYHNTEAKNVNSIKENGILASKATDPNFNSLTATRAGITEEAMAGKTYLAKNRKVARSAGVARQMGSNPLSTPSDILKSYKTQKTIKVNIPLNEYKKMNFVANPELKGATNAREYIDQLKKNNPLFMENAVSRKSLNKTFDFLNNQTRVVQGDIVSKFIKGGKGYKGQTLKGLANHIKENPKMFAKGMAKGSLGLGAAGVGGALALKSLSNNVKKQKEIKQKNKDLLAEYITLKNK